MAQKKLNKMKENKFKTAPPKKQIAIEIILICGLLITTLIFISRFCWANVMRFEFAIMPWQCSTAIFAAALLSLIAIKFLITILKELWQSKGK